MKPILFNTDMVRAILDNRKTVTRRVVKPQPAERPVLKMCSDDVWRIEWWDVNEYHSIKVPYCIGEILYVRETFFEHKGHFYYKADGKHEALAQLGIVFKWRPSIHMPREAARIFLRVTDVRVERLRDITEEQARAEGVSPMMITTDVEKPDDKKEWYEWGPALIGFIHLWGSTLKKADRTLYGLDANPWVFVISFERISKDEAMQ